MVVGHEEVIDQERVALHAHLAYLPVVELAGALKIGRPRAGQQFARRAVDLDVDIVAVKVKVVELEIAVVVLHVVDLVVDGVQQRALRAVGHHAAPGDEDGAHHQADDEQHHQREVDGDAGLDGDEPHGSSLSTQPTPRTVWMSFLSKSASILRRR